MGAKGTREEAGEQSGYGEDGSNAELEFAKCYGASDLPTSLSVLCPGFPRKTRPVIPCQAKLEDVCKDRNHKGWWLSCQKGPTLDVERRSPTSKKPKM